MPRVWKNFNTTNGDSPLATHLADDFDDYRKSPERKSPVSHLVVHMTGSTIVGKAIKAGLDPYEACLSYYTSKGTSSHYLLGYDGQLYQLSDEHLRVPHVGVSPDERAAYLSGAWAQGGKAEGQEDEGLLGPISKKTVTLWRAAWPNYKSPQALFPTRFVNDCSVGVEMPPCGYPKGRGWTPLPDVHQHKNTRHTVEQHLGIAALVCDVATRWHWMGDWWKDPKGGSRTPYIPGHEDVDLYGRSQPSGGWDPGGLRTEPWWDWPFVYEQIVKMRSAAALVSVAEAFEHALFQIAGTLSNLIP